MSGGRGSICFDKVCSKEFADSGPQRAHNACERKTSSKLFNERSRKILCVCDDLLKEGCPSPNRLMHLFLYVGSGVGVASS